RGNGGSRNRPSATATTTIATNHLPSVPSSSRAYAAPAGWIPPPSATAVASALPRSIATPPAAAASAWRGPAARNPAATTSATAAWMATARVAARRPMAMGSCTRLGLLRWEVLVPVAASKNGSAEPQNYNSGPFSAATAAGARKVNGTGSGANFPLTAGSTPARPASFLVSRRRPHPCRSGARAATRAASRRERRSYRTLFRGDVEVGDGAFEDLGAQADRLGEGRVRVDGVADVGRLRAHLDRQRDLGDELAGMHADDAAADDAAGIRIEQQLGEALGAAQADGAAGSGPRELRHLDRDALGPGLGLGDPDPGDLRVGVGHRRDHPRHPLALVPGRHRGGDVALVGGLVRQHRLADQVADREDVRHVGAHLRVHRDEASLGHLHPGLAGIELAAVGRAADGDQHAVVELALGEALALEAAGDTVLLRLGLDHLRFQVDRDALLLEARGQRPDQVGIGAGDELPGELDHRHLAAEAAVHGRHL